MNEKIKNHINMLFEKAPQTRKAFELKEELMANSEERYQDLITSGISPEDAIKNVINSIGNVSELFQGLEETVLETNSELTQIIKKSAIFKAIAVGIYIFSIVVIFIFVLINDYVNTRNIFDTVDFLSGRNRINYSIIGIILAILIDIVPTCMLIYVYNLTPKYKRQEDTVVEEFKEWNNNSHKEKSIKRAASGVLWTATVFLFFVISFATMAWYATWLIFLVALCVQTIIELYYKIRS